MLKGPPPKSETMAAKDVFHEDAKYQEWCKVLALWLQGVVNDDEVAVAMIAANLVG